MEVWREISDVDLIPAGPSMWTIGTLRILVVRQGDQFFALDDSCPHAGASLANGKFSCGVVQCRAHGLKFDLVTGNSSVGAGLSLTKYLTRIRDGQLIVLVQCGEMETDRMDN